MFACVAAFALVAVAAAAPAADPALVQVRPCCHALRPARPWLCPRARPPIRLCLSQLNSGTIRGYVGTKSRSFLGVPFAAPPVGDLRWQAPTAPKVHAPVRVWLPWLAFPWLALSPSPSPCSRGTVS